MERVICIYTGSRKMVMIDKKADLEYNVADMGLELLFLPKCREIWKRMEQEILNKKQHVTDRPLIVVIRCQHGQYRSVETAKRLKKEYLKGMDVSVTHISLANENPQSDFTETCH